MRLNLETASEPRKKGADFKSEAKNGTSQEQKSAILAPNSSLNEYVYLPNPVAISRLKQLPSLNSFEIDEKIIVHCFLKRSFDIIFSLAALLLGFPIFALIALLVKLSSSGPVLYCSLRIGRRGRLFKFWKFRSMHRDADQRLEVILSSDPKLQREWQKYFKLQNDPRLTRIGSFLRKTSLDELPQFWNVLFGDLSIVGPRPYLPREAETIQNILGGDVEKMFSIRPGLTGIWQTSGRNNLTFEERVKLEVSYLEKRSFLFDLKLIIKTIPILLFRRGAF